MQRTDTRETTRAIDRAGDSRSTGRRIDTAVHPAPPRLGMGGALPSRLRGDAIPDPRVCRNDGDTDANQGAGAIRTLINLRRRICHGLARRIPENQTDARQAILGVPKVRVRSSRLRPRNLPGVRRKLAPKATRSQHRLNHAPRASRELRSPAWRPFEYPHPHQKRRCLLDLPPCVRPETCGLFRRPHKIQGVRPATPRFVGGIHARQKCGLCCIAKAGRGHLWRR